jgi:DNA-binding IclR family transcriptional regulator
MTREEDKAGATGSQTLDRGLLALKLVVASDHPRSIQEVADELGVHRSIAYRILRTLHHHRLLDRDEVCRYTAGLELAVLARAVRRSLQVTALPELSDVANALHMTAFLVVQDGNEAITLTVVEPRHSQIHVARRPGTRHPIDRGAPGLAILAGGTPIPGERPEVTQARARGWAMSKGEVIENACSVAVPILSRGGNLLGAIAVVHMDATRDPELIAASLLRAAAALRKSMP